MNTQPFRRLLPVLLLPLMAASAPVKPAPVKPAVETSVHGDYVEARTASVFAGACHYNGERVTEGRSAILAWSVRGGSYHGVDLSGVRVLAAVACDDNLAEAKAARTSELTIDAADDATATAAAAWVKATLGDQLGTVVKVLRAAVTFTHDSEAFAVASAGEASMTVKPMPDAGCCSQPHLVWYQPLMPVEHRRVGYTEAASCTSGVTTWSRSDENSAFYGTF